MNTTKGKSELDDLKKREYYKQQQQLRTLAKRNAISADAMIENLLSRKEIFQKKKDMNHTTGKGSQEGIGWLVPGSPEVPWVYQTVWEAVAVAGSGLADTSRLSTLLMSSRLTTDTLGYIWGLANRTVPGSLTQKEVYIALALVALAQNGQTFSSATVLERCREAPVPRLEVGAAQVLPTVPTVAHGLGPPPTVVPLPAAHPPSDALSTLSALELNGAVGSLPDPTTDFGEFQSVFGPPRAPPRLPLRPPERNYSSVDVLSLALANSLPPPPLLRTDDILTGREPTDDEEFDDFKSAELPGGVGPLTVLDLPKPLGPPPPPPSSARVKPEETANVEDLFPVSPLKRPDGPSSDLLDLFQANLLTPPTGTPPVKSKEPEEEVRAIEIGEPLLMSEEVVRSGTGVSGASEDKYRALRMLEEEVEPATDDFGDFLTADKPPPTLQPLALATHQPSIQVRCLSACLRVLRTGLTTLEGIKEPEILSEVTSSQRGKQYLQDLVEVHRVSMRLKANTEKGELQKELDKVWQSLQPYLKDLEQSHMEDEEGAKCGVCLSEVGPSHVRYGINNFHAPCANFFLHCVDPVLPIAPVML